MQEVISLQFKYTEAEAVAAMRLYMKRSADFKIRVAVCLLYSFACVFLAAWLGLDFDSEVILLFAFVACLPFLIGFLHLFVIPRQRFRRGSKSHGESLLQFSDDGIHLKTSQVDALLQWSLYDKVLEDERLYLLVDEKSMIYLIPKRAFASASQEAAFRALLGRHLSGRFDAKRLRESAASAPEYSYVPPAEPPDWR